MLARVIALAAIALSMGMQSAVSQENCVAGEPGCNAPVVSPLQNPFYLFPWMANTAPSISSNINAQGIAVVIPEVFDHCLDLVGAGLAPSKHALGQLLNARIEALRFVHQAQQLLILGRITIQGPIKPETIV